MKLYKLAATQTGPEMTGKLISLALEKCPVVHVIGGPYKDPQTTDDFYAEVVKSIGLSVPMEENPQTGDKTGNMLTDIKYPWHEASDSYSHSNTRQPLHTDGSYEKNSPNISYFYCKEYPEYGGGTMFITKNELIAILESYDSKLLAELKETPVRFSKGNDFKERPIIGEGLTWNWHRCQHNDLTQRFHDFLENMIVDGGLTISVKLHRGEALFFHDEEVLHGRHSFVGSRWLVKGGVNYERPRNR